MNGLLLLFAVSNLLYFALQVTSSSAFPKPLSAKQEREYLERVKQGDREAKDKLVEHNLRLVAHVIKKYYSSNVDQDDLISIGTIGLIKAVSTFDYTKGTRFATYASRCIENETLMFFRNKKKSASDVYISDPIDVDKDGNSLTLIDVMADSQDIIDDIDLRLKSQKLYDYVQQKLDKREQEIIVMRYGLWGQKPLTQREVAEKLHISRSYVSRIEKKAIGILRKSFERNL